MPTFYKYLPGPTANEEYSSLAALKASIETNSMQRPVVNGALGWGESGTPPWYQCETGWTYTANGGLPYLQVTFTDSTSSNILVLRYRYALALVGLLDPLTWFPGIFSPLSLVAQSLWQLANTRISTLIHANLVGTLYNAVENAALCGSTSLGSLTSGNMTYSYGSKSGQVFGCWIAGSYAPTVPEQGSGIKRSYWLEYLIAPDADDGTIGLIQGSGTMGENYSQVPYLTLTTAGQDGAWGDLGTQVGYIGPEIAGVKGSIDNALVSFVADNPNLPLSWVKVPKALALQDPEAVTHASDQTGDSYTPVIGTPPAALFSVPGAVSACVASPTTMLALSKPAAIKVVSLAATGVAAATAISVGLMGKLATAADAVSTWVSGGVETYFDKMVELVDWMQSASAPPTRTADATERQADASEGASEILERIAVALERIADEVCRDPADPIVKQGIVNAVELASQARSELEVRVAGVHVSAMTGVVVDGSP